MSEFNRAYRTPAPKYGRFFLLVLVIGGGALAYKYVDFGDADQGDDKKAEESLDQWVTRKKGEFSTQRTQLEERLNEGIPNTREKLKSQAKEVRAEIAKADSGLKVKLESELREIARGLVALEKKEDQTATLIASIKSEERRLERVGIAKLLEDDSSKREAVDKVWKDASAAISAPVDETLGSTVDDLEVDSKLADLLK